MGNPASAVIKQHLIDPEICIHCNTCETTCPSGAITHGAKNYVVDVAKCKLCMACIQPCPTGAIDSWRTMPRAKAYSVETQMAWDSLPDELTAAELATTGVESAVAPISHSPAAGVTAGTDGMQYSATLPPWSAAHLEGDEILGGASMQTGESAETEARMAVQEALRQTGLKREDLKAAVATGTLAVPVTAALNIAALKTRSPASCIATGAYFRFPEARTVLYVGADVTCRTIMRCGREECTA